MEWAKGSELGETQQGLFVQILFNICPPSEERVHLSSRYRRKTLMRVLQPALGEKEMSQRVLPTLPVSQIPSAYDI